MAENTDPHAPGIYEKDGEQRRANSRSAAVALVFEGFKRVTAEAKVEEPEQTETPKIEEQAPVVAPRPVPAPPKPTEKKD